MSRGVFNFLYHEKAVPLGVEQVLKASDDIADGWNNVFLLSALVSLLGGTLFLAFGSGKSQNYGASKLNLKDNFSTLDSRNSGKVFINEEKSAETVSNCSEKLLTVIQKNYVR